MNYLNFFCIYKNPNLAFFYISNKILNIILTITFVFCVLAMHSVCHRLFVSETIFFFPFFLRKVSVSLDVTEN